MKYTRASRSVLERYTQPNPKECRTIVSLVSVPPSTEVHTNKVVRFTFDIGEDAGAEPSVDRSEDGISVSTGRSPSSLYLGCRVTPSQFQYDIMRVRLVCYDSVVNTLL